MSSYVLVLLSLILAAGWSIDHRRQKEAISERDRQAGREMTEILPEVAQHAAITTFSTLCSISLFPPFCNVSNSNFGDDFTQLGVNFRKEVLESQQRWFTKLESTNAAPLLFAKVALSAFDDVLAKYSSEINHAHEAMMMYYQNRPMPVRNQDGFNWVRLW